MLLKNMLEKLFGSKARVKLLKNFLLNSDKKFYIRQLARDLKLQVNSVRRELNNLEDFGLLTSVDDNNIKSDTLSTTIESKKNDQGKDSKEVISKEAGLNEKKYYWVNKSFILFSEIKSLIVKSQILAGESFIKNLKLICDPKFILLSGMFVNNENSPTDVLIVAKVENEKLIEIIKDLEQELSKEVNFTVMEEAEFKYRQEVADVFLHGVLNSRKIILLDKILNINNEINE